MAARLSQNRFLFSAIVIGAVLAESASGVQFQALTDLQTGIGFTTVLTLGPEDPDPANNGDGCVYAVNGDQGAVHRICFDDSKTVSRDTVDSDHAESRLSSAVLRVRSKDTAGDVDPSFDGNCGDVNTQDACDIDVYASGPALFRINSGGGVFVDSLGLTWSADTFFAADRDGPTRRSSLRT